MFNEAENPQSDRTAAVGPAVNLWLRMGRARLSAQASGQYLYFQEFSTQRAWNTANTARIELPLARFMPFASGSFANTRQRAGFEIDSRARMRAGGASLGSSVRLSGKTSLVLTASQNQIRFDRDETFLGESLANALDRSTTAEQLDVRFNLTPLTTFVLTSEALQDRFDVSDDRNADSIRIMPGFEMKPLALISGRAAVGIRHFNVLSNRTPDFTGLVANVSASSSIAATKLEARWARDITYSYQVEEPYYALNDFGFIVTQRITAGWDVVARTGWQALHYRRNIDAVAAIPRTDRAALYGGGIGYLLGQGIRLGFDVNYYRRNSDALGFRNFEGLRMGASVGYGLTQ